MHTIPHLCKNLAVNGKKGGCNPHNTIYEMVGKLSKYMTISIYISCLLSVKFCNENKVSVHQWQISPKLIYIFYFNMNLNFFCFHAVVVTLTIKLLMFDRPNKIMQKGSVSSGDNPKQFILLMQSVLNLIYNVNKTKILKSQN